MTVRSDIESMLGKTIESVGGSLVSLTVGFSDGSTTTIEADLVVDDGGVIDRVYPILALSHEPV